MSYSYDVFGAIRSQTGTSANYWLFTGEQRDVSEALYYLRARYYDPGTGRFLSQDPLGIGHQYGYVQGNPVNALDPYGLFCIGPKELCNVVNDVVNKPINDVKDTVDNVEVLVSHPGSVIQQTGGLAVARFSFGDRFEREDAVFYSHCWGLCSIFRAVPDANNITIGHFVFSRGGIDERTIQHELVHVRQGDQHGLLWPFEYLREQLRHGYNCNRFEEEARRTAGQPSRCASSNGATSWSSGSKE